VSRQRAEAERAVIHLRGSSSSSSSSS
jgi:hypothetical protein